MNEERFKLFSEAYRAGLLAAMRARPEAYVMLKSAEDVPFAAELTADKMLKAIKDKPAMVAYNGDGFKRTCKALGISNTRKAIFEYLEISK